MSEEARQDDEIAAIEEAYIALSRLDYADQSRALQYLDDRLGKDAPTTAQEPRT